MNEQSEYFNEKIGDILTGVHELLSAGKQVSTRHLMKHSEFIANQIRKVLHTSWPKSQMKYLLRLQKCGVALMNGIEKKGDLSEILNGVRSELEKIVEKLGMPINTLASPSDEKTPMPQMPETQPPPQQSELQQ